MEDEAIPLPFRARLQGYFRSGYDRGHAVPAADAENSQSAMDETFLLSNIAPQVGAGPNRYCWCRRLTGNFSDVSVFAVPLRLPHRDPDGKNRVTYEVIGSPPNISAPTHFAKVVLPSQPSSPSTPHLQEISTGAFVLPKSRSPMLGGGWEQLAPAQCARSISAQITSVRVIPSPLPIALLGTGDEGETIARCELRNDDLHGVAAIKA
ncbi:unnamed protein product [Peniophora sp. CBMAI 1063]|nr:unnamed protein product [Peniophora sp. CBMAI 1063]